MAVDRFQLVVVVAVWLFVARPIRSAAVRIVRVIHTGAEDRVVEGLVLMVEAEVVPDFLAHHQAPPRRGVVGRGIEVTVVEPRGGSGDVRAADGDPRHAEPAVAAVGPLHTSMRPVVALQLRERDSPGTLVRFRTVDALHSLIAVVQVGIPDAGHVGADVGA